MKLRTITTPSGAKFSVADEHADRFGAFLADLEAGGYAIKGDQSGGYNDRNIAGTNIKSHHATGSAIDLNWNNNPRGAAGAISPELARSLAAKHGLTWGGDWKNPDPMHFEAAGAVRPPATAPIPAAGGQTAPAMEASSQPETGGLVGLLTGSEAVPATQGQQQAVTPTGAPDAMELPDIIAPPEIPMPRLRPLAASPMRMAAARIALGRRG